MVVLEDPARDFGVTHLRPLSSRPVSTVAANDFLHANGTRIGSFEPSAGVRFSRGWRRLLERWRDPRFVAEAAILLAIVVIGIGFRLHFASFLDPFEDGYQNWWISANLASTGQYWDRHSMMTQGNWLPLFHFAAAGVLELAGLYNMVAVKAINIVLSSLTALLVFAIARRDGPIAGLAATSFFSFTFIDIVVSGWATAESLATVLVLLAYAAIFHFHGLGNKRYWIAAAALALATLTRYEAWLIVGLLVLFVLIRKDAERTMRLVTVIPSIAVMGAFFLYALQWGFLPAIVVAQTSTDIRYQLAIGTQPNPGDLLSRWWTGYLLMLPVVLPVGAAYAVRQFRRDFGSWVVLSLWGFIVFYSALRFGNPSFRYVMISVPFLSIFTARGLGIVVGRIVAYRHRMASAIRITPAFALVFVVLFAAGSLLPSTVLFWTDGFASSGPMVPLEHAGLFVQSLPQDPSRILLSESPIAAYFSGYQPDRILGSRWLSDNRSAALSYMKANVQYIVYMGVPYYRLRILFPELQKGTSTPDFQLLYDAGGLQLGTHAVYVYRVVYG
jgi:uncharacterized membrane protein